MNPTPSRIITGPELEIAHHQEMLDGYPVDRRPAVDVSNQGQYRAFINDILLKKADPNDYRLFDSKTPTFDAARKAEEIKKIHELVRINAPLAKKMRKAARPRWRQ